MRKSLHCAYSIFTVYLVESDTPLQLKNLFGPFHKVITEFNCAIIINILHLLYDIIILSSRNAIRRKIGKNGGSYDFF